MADKFRHNHIRGQTLGYLLVLSRASNTKAGQARWLCRCICGKEKLFPSYLIVSGRTKSCGCKAMVFGPLGPFHKHPYYKLWKGMRDRCNNPRNKQYPHYGGRGISVCERWDDYEAFVMDMGDRPTPKHSVDRIDVNGNYEPNNCRWATPSQQAQNSRRTVLSAEKVAQVRSLRHLGPKSLSERFQVSKSTINGVLSGRTWKGVGENAI